MCSSQRRRMRRRLLERGFRAWTQNGGALEHLTLALPHYASDRLEDSIERLLDGFQALQTGNAQREFRNRWGVRHYVRVLEVKCGCESGWNPHLHIALLLDHPLSEAERSDMERDVSTRIFRRLDKRHPGRIRRRGRQNAVVSTPVPNAATLAAYLTKPQRTPDPDHQGPLMPFDLLRLMDGHRTEDCCRAERPNTCPRLRTWQRLWREYVAAMERHRWIAFSRGCVSTLEGLALAQDDRADVPDTCTDVVLELSNEEWMLVYRAHGGNASTALRQAARHGVASVRALIEAASAAEAQTLSDAPLPTRARGRFSRQRVLQAVRILKRPLGTGARLVAELFAPAGNHRVESAQPESTVLSGAGTGFRPPSRWRRQQRFDLTSTAAAHRTNRPKPATAAMPYERHAA